MFALCLHVLEAKQSYSKKKTNQRRRCFQTDWGEKKKSAFVNNQPVSSAFLEITTNAFLPSSKCTDHIFSSSFSFIFYRLWCGSVPQAKKGLWHVNYYLPCQTMAFSSPLCVLLLFWWRLLELSALGKTCWRWTQHFFICLMMFSPMAYIKVQQHYHLIS